MALCNGEGAAGVSYRKHLAPPLKGNSLIHVQPDLKPKQSELEETLLKVISGTEGYPTPGRAIRRVVGRCLVVLYTRGETRTMFDTLQALMKLVGDPKLDKEPVKMYEICFSYRRNTAD